MDRLAIYPKDVQRILGRSLNYSRKLLRTIKEFYGKSPHQYVSVEEFSEFTGLPVDKIYDLLK